MKKIIFDLRFILFTNLLVSIEIEGTVFGLIYNMESLVMAQNQLIESIAPYITDVPDSNRSVIENYLERSQKENLRAKKNIKRFLAHPTNCYVLVKRLSRDLNYVESILYHYTDYERNQNLNLPNENQFHSAVASIVVLVYIYGVDVKELSRGSFTRNYRRNMKKYSTISTKMTSSDCYEVGLAALLFEECVIALAWLNEAFYKYQKDCQDACPFTQSDIVGDVRRALEKIERIVLFFPVEQAASFKKVDDIKSDQGVLMEAENRMKILPISLRRKIMSERKDYLTLWQFEKRHLCYMENVKRNRLHCQYRYGPHPFLRLARFKAELLHQQPEIVMFHDVISDQEIKLLKHRAELMMNRTNLHKKENTNFSATTLRFSYLVDDRVSKISATISRRSLDISGMPEAYAEGNNILNYGAAGYHKPHINIKPITSGVNTPAQASVVYTFSEPNLGGAISFPMLNFSVFRTKNSALYWRTSTPDEVDNSVHASCPVLYGSMWSLSKWLFYPATVGYVEQIREAYEHFNLKPLNYDSLRKLLQ